MRSAFLASIMAMLVSATIVFSAAGTVGGPVSFACRGAKADAARKIAKDHNLPLGMDPKTCFGELLLTESARQQIVVAAPSQSCTAGQLLNVYDRSRAEAVVCAVHTAGLRHVDCRRAQEPLWRSYDRHRRAALPRAGEFVPFK